MFPPGMFPRHAGRCWAAAAGSGWFSRRRGLTVLRLTPDRSWDLPQLLVFDAGEPHGAWTSTTDPDLRGCFVCFLCVCVSLCVLVCLPHIVFVSVHWNVRHWGSGFMTNRCVQLFNPPPPPPFAFCGYAGETFRGWRRSPEPVSVFWSRRRLLSPIPPNRVFIRVTPRGQESWHACGPGTRRAVPLPLV